MAFYETMQERVASILAELDVRAEPALEVVAVCARQIRFGSQLLQTPFMRQI